MKQRGLKQRSVAVLKRVIGYMLHYYKILFALVILCILVNAVCTVVGATFPQTLVDDYIVPMLNTGSNDFSALASDLVRLACIMACGVVAAFLYNRIMVNVSQRALPYSSPLRYFLAFLLLQYTMSRRAAAPATPISRSKGWKLGAAFAKAAEQPSMKCSSFSDKSTPAASRYACPSFPNR